MGVITLATSEEVDRLSKDIARSFQPCDERDCPFFWCDYEKDNIKKEDSLLKFNDGHGLERVLESVPEEQELDLSKLEVGTAVYFCGRQGAAYYTLKIANNGLVKAWRDCDSNALIGPLNRITSREDKPIFYEGILKKKLYFVMPYFIYNTDEQFLSSSNAPQTKEVIQPGEVYFGAPIFLAIERPKK